MRSAFVNVGRSERGVGMVEILVALVLISFAFLAAARMQVQGMRFTQSAYYQSQAFFLASDIADRMRANITGLAAGAYSGASIAADAVNPGCAAKVCTAGQIAQQDIYDWSAAVFSLGASGTAPTALPDHPETPPTGTITAVGDGVYRITMTWPEVVRNETIEETLSITFTGEAP